MEALEALLGARHKQEDKIRNALIELHQSKLVVHDNWEALSAADQQEMVDKVAKIERAVMKYLSGVNPYIKT